MLGKDIVETLESRHKKTRVTTYSASGEGNFGEQEGEAIYLAPFSAESLADVRMVVLAGSVEGAHKSYQIVSESGKKPVVVDTLGLLEQGNDTLLSSTLLGAMKAKPGQLITLAHPAASALTLILSRLSKYQAPVPSGCEYP